MTARQFVGTDAQLEDTIEKFVRRGYLSQHGNQLSITMQMLDWLITHARDFFHAISKQNAPATWSTHKGEWLSFNQIVFRYFYDEIGPRWRDMRNDINQAITAQKARSRAKKSERSYATDYVGEPPEYWVVISVAAFIENVSEFSFGYRAEQLGLQQYVAVAADITTAIDDLCDYGILTKSGGIVQLDTRFSARMDALRKAVNENVPKLRAECHGFLPPAKTA